MGPAEFVRVSPTLWVVLAIPMAGVLWQTMVVRPWVARRAGPTGAARAIDYARIAGFAFLSLTAAAFLAHVSALRAADDPGNLIDAVIPAAPVGAIDTSLVLALDRLSASLGAVACLLGLACAARLASRPSPERGWAAWAWLEFALAATLACLLADGVWTLAVGWAMVTVAGAWILASDDARASVALGGRGAMAIGALLVGGSALFAGLGEEARSHLEAVLAHDANAPDPAGSHEPDGSDEPSATITLTSPAGSLVLIDEATTPSLRAPFVRAPIGLGRHVIHVRTGPGADEAAIGVSFAAGDDVTLVTMGPTGSFHAMAEQLAIRHERGRRASASATGAEATGQRTWPAALTAMLAWLAGASLMCRMPFSTRSPAPLAAFANGLMGPAIGPTLLARTSFLWPLAPSAKPLIAAVGGAALAAVVARAFRRPRAMRLAALAGGAPSAVTLLAIGSLSTGGTAVAVPAVVLVGSIVALWLPRSPTRGTAVSRLEERVFIEAPVYFGRFCARMDRWVVGAWIAAAAATARALAWTLAAGEEAFVRRASDEAASQAVRLAREVEPLIGVPLGRLVWVALGVLAAAVLGHALWFGS